ncbi:MAG TPA: hypothetical protein VNJ07_03135, partial [Chitinophagales bacterium]|nr:hypothetical protein [Chitinophagales bacterium]
DVFKTVRENIDAALSRGFYIKVNAVMMKGVNEDELNEFVAWTKDVPLHVRFIEFMPFEGNRWQRHRVMTYKEIFSRIAERFPVEKLSDHFNSTSKSYRVKGYAGTFAVISSVSQPFCETCNRLRLTADGKLRNCLFSRAEWDLLAAMRHEEDIRPLILEAVNAKAFQQGGSLFDSRCAESSRPARAMVKIGG